MFKIVEITCQKVHCSFTLLRYFTRVLGYWDDQQTVLGRLLALIKSKKLILKNVKHFILDECDKMLEQLGMLKDTFPQKIVFLNLTRAVLDRLSQRPLVKLSTATALVTQETPILDIIDWKYPN